MVARDFNSWREDCSVPFARRAHDGSQGLLVPGQGCQFPLPPGGRTMVARDFNPWVAGPLFIHRPAGGREPAMPSAYTQNFYHTVFSTSRRMSLLTPELESRLYPFMGGILRDLRCQLLAIN